MRKAVFLDTGPLGVACKRKGLPDADGVRAWLYRCAQAGVAVYLPEVADYEVRRELLREGLDASLARLDALCEGLTYVPLTTAAVRRAARMWADARNSGLATSPPHALDGDVLVSAQALTSGADTEQVVVATDNVKHIGRYVTAATWPELEP